MVIVLSIVCLLLVGACIYLADRLYKLNRDFNQFKMLNTFTNAVPRRKYQQIKKYLDNKKSIFSKKSRYELQDMINSLLLIISDRNVESYVTLAYNMSLTKTSDTDTQHKHQAIHYLEELIKTDTFNKEYFKELIYHLYCIINNVK